MMLFFSTYYQGTPISFVSNVNEELAVNKLLRKKELEIFFEKEKSQTFISTNLINSYKNINRYFLQINKELKIGDFFFGQFETFNARKNRLWFNKLFFLRNIFFTFDFLLNRVIPKLKGINRIYFFIFRKRNRVLSKAEVLGRLVHAGFEIVKVENIDGLCYFKVKKFKDEPQLLKSSMGLIFKMKRIGKNGKLFNVYKFRTMHPYSEYLQDYVIKEHGFAENGKLVNDFRLTPWGKVLRKFWIDELPQLVNVLKGEMKLVGIRPVSRAYYNLLPEEFKKTRNKFKPGCIPPYVALNYTSSVVGVLKAEKEYIIEKLKNPYTTDLKYFFKAIFNIVFRGKRSA